MKSIWLRFLIGFTSTLIVVVAGFSIVMANIPAGWASPEEAALPLPGDEVIAQPSAYWTVARTVQAPAEEVYPWLVQIGDTRAGYYSYQFLERLFDPHLYHNADRVHPEWQAPERGLGVIRDMVAVEDYAPGKWFYLKSTEKMAPAEWTWVWKVEPIDANTSRLVNRFRIGVPPDVAGNPVVSFVIYTGGFVMEQNMMQGIAQRAEGRGEFIYIEPVEIALWLAALLTGLWAARMYLRQEKWQLPLAVGLLAVVWLFVLTFVQPVIWLRLLGDAVLVGGALWARQGKPVTLPTRATQPSAVNA